MIDTDMSDNMSATSLNVAAVFPAILNPFVVETTNAPPPSVFKMMTSRIPGLVGVASVRVSPAEPTTISQICMSEEARMVPASPGSFSSFGPMYSKW